MVGVLNGKKAFSVVVVAFLLCGVFGGLVAQQSLSLEGSYLFGYYGELGAGSAWASPGGLFNNFTVAVPDGTYCNAKLGMAYLERNVTGSSANATFAIYDGNGFLVWVGDYVSVTGEGWWNWTIGVPLGEGAYRMGVYGYNLKWHYAPWAGDNVSLDYVTAGGLPTQASWTSAGADTLSIVLVYDVFGFGSGADLSSVAVSDWGGLVVSVFLIAVCLLLALKSRSWAVNFLFGLGLVGFLGWVMVNQTVEMFGGWLDYLVLLGAVLVLVKGAVLVRASGV